MRRRPLGLDVTGARLEDVEAGHEIEGPAIVEHVATTFAISPGRSAGLDGQGIFHLGASG